MLAEQLEELGAAGRQARWDSDWTGPSLVLIHSRSSDRRPGSRPPPYWPTGVDAIIRSAADEPVVLVPHSSAGLDVPAVVDALSDQVRGAVFVDAALPGAGHHTTPDFLSRLARSIECCRALRARLAPRAAWIARSICPGCIEGIIDHLELLRCR